MADDLRLWYGFPNDAVAKRHIDQGTGVLSDEDLARFGLICAQSLDPTISSHARPVIRKFQRVHELSRPLLLIKWALAVTTENREASGQAIEEWAKRYTSDRGFARAAAWFRMRGQNVPGKIAAMKEHVAVFWNDWVAWDMLGRLYEDLEGGKWGQAAFCYDEAIALNESPDVLVRAAKARVKLQGGAEDLGVARNQLARAILLDRSGPAGQAAVDALIELTGDARKKERLRALRATYAC